MEAQTPFTFLQSHQVKMCLQVIKYAAPFLDHKEDLGIFMNPMSILRIKMDRAKVPWTELRFETRSQSNTPFADWVTRLLSNSVISKR